MLEFLVGPSLPGISIQEIPDCGGHVLGSALELNDLDVVGVSKGSEQLTQKCRGPSLDETISLELASRNTKSNSKLANPGDPRLYWPRPVRLAAAFDRELLSSNAVNQCSIYI